MHHLFIFLQICILTLTYNVIDGREINGTVNSSNIASGTSLTQRFTNPITWEPVDYGTFVYLHTDGFYYFTKTVNNRNNFTVIRSPSLVNWENSERTIVLNMTDPFVIIKEPELHFIRGDWYIYFQARITGVTRLRNYVMKSKNPLTPMEEYDRPIKLISYDVDVNAQDGTVFEHDDGELYFVWIGFYNETSTRNRLFIAPMFSPTEISGSKVDLGNVTVLWEMCGANPGMDTPQVLKRKDRTFITFRVSSGPSTCVGIMGLDYGQHPLVAENWWRKTDGPVFWDNEAQKVSRVNIVAFTRSPDDTESWFLYDAEDGMNQTIRAERFSWNTDDFPVFPRPAGLSLTHKIPSAWA